MSQITRDIRFSVRLSDDEKAELNKLSDSLNLDKSATVRHALKLLSQSQIRPNIGIFTTLQQQEIPIQFDHKESHD
jgi:predicted transcriptional regulator